MIYTFVDYNLYDKAIGSIIRNYKVKKIEFLHLDEVKPFIGSILIKLFYKVTFVDLEQSCIKIK